MRHKKGKLIKEPVCKRCQRDLMAMTAAGEYICGRCGYIGEPVWVELQPNQALFEKRGQP